MQAFNYDVENLYYCDVVEKIYCYVYDLSVSLFASHASHSLSNVVSGHRKHQIGSSGHEIIRQSSGKRSMISSKNPSGKSVGKGPSKSPVGMGPSKDPVGMGPALVGLGPLDPLPPFPLLSSRPM